MPPSNAGRTRGEHGRERHARVRSLGKGLQRCEHHALVGRGAREAETGHREHPGNLGLRQDNGLRLRHDAGGVVERGSRGCLHDHHEVAFVLVRHERRGHRAIDGPRRHERHREERKHCQPPAQRATYDAHIHVCATVDHAVHEGEEAAVGMALLVEQECRQGRRERHGVEHRQDHGARDGQGELLVHLSGRAGEERHRNEHRDQHDTDHDHGAEDFTHGVH